VRDGTIGIWIPFGNHHLKWTAKGFYLDGRKVTDWRKMTN
jgi:hypothetical protein